MNVSVMNMLLLCFTMVVQMIILALTKILQYCSVTGSDSPKHQVMEIQIHLQRTEAKAKNNCQRGSSEMQNHLVYI